MSTNEVREDELVIKQADDIMSIPSKAYKGCSFKSVVIESNTIKSIEAEAFCDCVNLESFIIPQGVISLGDRVFAGCTSLQYVVIPSSVMMVGVDVFADCNPELIIIGKYGTKAAELANAFGLALRTDVNEVVAGLQKSREARENRETRVFELFGVNVTCSNSQILYDNIYEYYDKTLYNEECKKMCDSILAYIPNDCRNYAQEDIVGFAINDDFVPYHVTKKRLAEYAVFVTDSELAAYCQAGLQNISNMVSNIRLESLKWYSETIKRCNEVTEEWNGYIARGWYEEYGSRYYCRKNYEREKDLAIKSCRNSYISSANVIWENAKTYVAQVLLGLLYAELDWLTRAGVLSQDCVNQDKKTESDGIMAQITDSGADNRYHLALVLKAYPRNAKAYIYAIEHGYGDDTFKELSDFMQMGQLYFNHLVWNVIYKYPLAEAMERVAKFEGYLSLELSYEMIIRNVAEDIEKLLADKEKIHTGSIENMTLDRVRTVVIKLINKVVTKEQWTMLVEGSNRKNNNISISDTIPMEAQCDWGLIVEWLTKEYYAVLLQKKEQYDRAETIRNSSKKKKELEEAEKQFLQLGDFLDAKQKAQDTRDRIKKLRKKKSLAIAFSIVGVVLVAAAVVAVLYVLPLLF